MTNKPPSLIADLLDLLDVDLRYEFEERAGIMEFDGLLPRDDAEALALIDLLRTYPDALVGMTAAVVVIDGRTQFLLTTDLDAARQKFDALDLSLIRVADLAKVIEVHFGGMALIAKLP